MSEASNGLQLNAALFRNRGLEPPIRAAAIRKVRGDAPEREKH
jgi:hypothetical protein